MTNSTTKIQLFLKTFEQDIRIAFAFLTRIPVSYPVDKDGKAIDRNLADASWAFPFVGLIVGLCGALVLIISDTLLHLPIYVSALLAITTTIIITGALHEDGLADVADGFGGSHDRDRKLEIMKDSTVGSYGSLALCITVLLRTVLLGSLLDWGGMDVSQEGEGFFMDLPTGIIAIMISAHIIGRGYAPLIMSHLPLARKNGLAAMANKPKLRSSYGGFLITLIFVFSLLPFFPALIVLSSAFCVLILLSWLSLKQIGGYTGDVLGSAVLLCEIAVYLSALGTLT
ncbi:adenosylcobinamide-GDP ribazoletransferase [Kiloniella antarctica]|uniref:Adenosylcobinamide-GDP ribazoletransferase n=1 Tax=Kiloniella antarctica TaxID=1550907 RepID=A0ABW5BK92_9PROT